MAFMVTSEKLKILLASVLAVLTPIQSVLSVTFSLVMVDLVLGIACALKQGEPIVSSKLKITAIKLFVYETAIVLAHLVGTHLTGPLIPVLNMVASVIGLTELKSVYEKLDILSGGSLLKAIIGRISPNSLSVKGPNSEEPPKAP